MSKLYRGLRKDEQPEYRTENLGRLLLAALNNWQEELAKGLQKKGFKSVRSSHISLLRHIDMEGTGITEIAQRAGITKQAVGQMVTVCKNLKLVKVVDDPKDRRAKIVTFTQYGRKLISEERSVIEKVDASVRDRLGERDFERLRAALTLLAD